MSTKYLVKAADGRTTSTRSSKKLALDWFQTDRDAIWIETDKGTVVHGTRPVEFEPAAVEAEEPAKSAKTKAVRMPKHVAADGHRYCNFCQSEKPLSEFYAAKSRCKACYKEYATAYFAAKKQAVA